MTKATFTAYARITGYDSAQLKALGVKLDHVFVTSSRHNNWNCFGGGIEEAREDIAIASSQGYVEWASHVYNPEKEGRVGRNPDAYPAAEVTELFNGVCQNAANRILVFTEDNIDVRKANASGLVTLLYGKYGFGIKVFIERVKSTAACLGIPEIDLSKILERIQQGQSAEAELDILKSVYTHKHGTPFPVIPAEQWGRVVKAHSNFQVSRDEEFNRIAQAKPGQDIRMDLVEALKPDLGTYYGELENAFGREAVLDIMQVLPPNICLALNAFDGSR
jgi:hypothetical protein